MKELQQSKGKPVLALRVGVVGHRELDGVDVEELRQRITIVLADIKGSLAGADESWGYTDAPAQLYLVNSLAEGSDQLSAACAVGPELGYLLRCPVPFSLDSYTQHFQDQTDASRTQFDELASKPGTSIVSMGCSDADGKRQEGYRAAASALLENSDLLIAVLDKDHSDQPGGTADTVERAKHARISVVEIDPKNISAAPKLFTCETGMSCESDYLSLGEHVRAIVAPHRLNVAESGSEAVSSEKPDGTLAFKSQQLNRRDRFLNEPLTRGGRVTWLCTNLLSGVYSPWWRLIEGSGNLSIKLVDGFKQMFGEVQSKPDDSAAEYVEAASQAEVILKMQAPFTRALERVDALSIFYMRLYRGSFVANYFFGGMAVLFALLSYFNTPHEVSWLVAELVVLAFIAINFAADRFWKWNERATDYRCLAELFRQQEVLAPLIRTAPYTRIPAHHQHGDPDTTWMNWYFRAIVRSECLLSPGKAEIESSPNVLSMTTEYLDAVHHRLLNGWIKGQQQFHHKLARRFVYVNRVFHTLTATLFTVTVFICLLHLQHPAGDDVGMVKAQMNTAQPAVDGDVAAAVNDPEENVVQDAGSGWRKGALLAILPAVLPAFLAAFHGISMQAEFERLAERSESMTRHLKFVAEEFADLKTVSGDDFGGAMGRRSSEIALTMLEEVLDWRVIYLGHSTELT